MYKMFFGRKTIYRKGIMKTETTIDIEPNWKFMKEFTKRAICEGSIAGVTVTAEGRENMEAMLASYEEIVVYLASDEGQARETERGF